MLRISTATRGDGLPVLVIEGSITDDELAILDEVCRERLNGSARLTLDLTHVTYLDDAALRYLCVLRARGAEVACRSPFIRELLARERS
ncbi:MAG: hypothetical protein KJZ69_08530 [Phycisphaerales bacterium]|nr:hypothetical protein [Phycisphaerales bacterium]